MSWLDEVDGGGALVSAARSLRDRIDAPRGSPGLRALADAVDAYAHGDDLGLPEDERFVEAAGALLGLLLVDALGGAHAVRGDAHRVRLGARGQIDPFAAVDAALDAEDPRSALRDHVARAEAEAAGTGPISRVALSFEASLAEARPDRHVTASFGLVLELDDGTEIDLARVAEATAGEPHRAVRAATDRLVTMLPGGPGGGALSWAEARTRLLPRLCATSFLVEMAGHGRGRLLARGVAHDVAVALIVAFEGRSRFLRQDELGDLGVGADEALRVAVDNLAGRSERARLARVDTHAGPMIIARTGDGLDSARLLLPGLHDVLSAELPSPILAAVPHRDALLAVTGADGAIVEAFRAHVADEHARAPHRISAALFEVGPEGVRAR